MNLQEFGDLFSVIQESVSYTSEGSASIIIAQIGSKNMLFELENVPEEMTVIIDIPITSDQPLIDLAMEIDSHFENWDQPTWSASKLPT